MFSSVILPVVLAMMLAACSMSEPLAGNPTQETPVDANDEAAATPAGEGVANLPFSHGKTFRALDEYLAHLERYAAPIDQPWWREIRPGVYEHVKRMPGAAPEIATRAELMQRFGFSR